MNILRGKGIEIKIKGGKQEGNNNIESTLMILPIFKNRGFKINSEHSYFGEINEKALYHMAYNYFQDSRLKKGLVIPYH